MRESKGKKSIVCFVRESVGNSVIFSVILWVGWTIWIFLSHYFTKKINSI